MHEQAQCPGWRVPPRSFSLQPFRPGGAPAPKGGSIALYPRSDGLRSEREREVGAIKELVPTRYETDFAGWAFEQAAALERGDWRALDVPHLVEELESMGKQQRAELRNRLAVLLAHLAKWDKQSALRSVHGRSWRATIDVQRVDLAKHMEDNASLQPYVPEAMTHAWKIARLTAASETGLPIGAFEADCPYSWAQAMNEGSMPE